MKPITITLRGYTRQKLEEAAFLIADYAAEEFNPCEDLIRALEEDIRTAKESCSCGNIESSGTHIRAESGSMCFETVSTPNGQTDKTKSRDVNSPNA